MRKNVEIEEPDPNLSKSSLTLKLPKHINKNKKSLAERLEKDSFANRKPGSSKKLQPIANNRKPNVYLKNEIGNYRVICKGRCVLQPQYYISIVTVVFTSFPVFFQVLYVNPNFVEN